MSLADLATFTYFFCNYRGQVGGSYSDGYPFTPGENPFALEEKRGWSTCFRKARDAKFKELRTAWAMEKAATSTKAFPDKSDQQPKPEKPWSRPEGVATISLDGLSPAHPG